MPGSPCTPASPCSRRPGGPLLPGPGLCPPAHLPLAAGAHTPDVLTPARRVHLLALGCLRGSLEGTSHSATRSGASLRGLPSPCTPSSPRASSQHGIPPLRPPLSLTPRPTHARPWVSWNVSPALPSSTTCYPGPPPRSPPTRPIPVVSEPGSPFPLSLPPAQPAAGAQ